MSQLRSGHSFHPCSLQPSYLRVEGGSGGGGGVVVVVDIDDQGQEEKKVMSVDKQ